MDDKNGWWDTEEDFDEHYALLDDIMEEKAREVQEGMDNIDETSVAHGVGVEEELTKALIDEINEEQAREIREGEEALNIEDEDGQLKEMIELANENGMVPKWAVLFIQDDDVIIHTVFYEERPNVASVSHNIEEMKTDEEFGIGEEETDLCSLVIIPIEDGGDIGNL